MRRKIKMEIDTVIDKVIDNAQRYPSKKKKVQQEIRKIHRESEGKDKSKLKCRFHLASDMKLQSTPPPFTVLNYI